MSVSMTKSEGVTVMTMTSDPGSACPPLCQILKALCYSPVCCNVSQKLRSVLGTSHSALGAMQVMVGLMNIGLGGVLSTSGSGYLLWESGYFPFWMGSLFIVFGFLCILSEKFPSLCLVVSSVTAQLSGVGFSITAVVLYFINLFHGEGGSWPCENNRYDYYRRESTGAPIDYSSDIEKCLEGLSIIKAILRGVNGLLIILSVLQLCLSISCVVLGIKAVKKGFKKEKKSEDIEQYSPLLTEKPAY
ncbi:high affinity immunoglobulin epsilon receptor subunit beta-like [Gadus chalcogrammus]|uniref:high affinity immunoglobulin epsilon receptor subunit beta-like n=1 Tax=Gadus chalcogrammus TaxID=1042646 RepID=UPI0024C49F91|nr:high affinity immunoglobulin epsilon receptor subunit beta-like [Gadus chalcogrammus]